MLQKCNFITQRRKSKSKYNIEKMLLQVLEQKRKVAVLERGQWWVSHELPSSPSSTKFAKKVEPDKGIREYLELNDIPYITWPYLDNINGLNQFLNTLRIVDRRGYVLGLNHVKFKRNLMSTQVDKSSATISPCLVEAVETANSWKLK